MIAALVSPLSRMQRPCRGVRCEHKVNAGRVARGTCERGAAAWERRPCGAAFPDGVVRACARQGARTRDGGEEEIVELGAWMVKRAGTCDQASARQCLAHVHGHARARCKSQDAVTVALAAALRATHLHDGAGARAVAAEMRPATSGSSGEDGTGACGAGATSQIRRHQGLVGAGWGSSRYWEAASPPPRICRWARRAASE